MTRLDAVGIPANILFGYDTLDSDSVATEKKLTTVSTVLPEICDICSCIVEQEHNNSVFDTNIHTLEKVAEAKAVFVIAW